MCGRCTRSDAGTFSRPETASGSSTRISSDNVARRWRVSEGEHAEKRRRRRREERGEGRVEGGGKLGVRIDRRDLARLCLGSVLRLHVSLLLLKLCMSRLHCRTACSGTSSGLGLRKSGIKTSERPEKAAKNPQSPPLRLHYMAFCSFFLCVKHTQRAPSVTTPVNFTVPIAMSLLWQSNDSDF